MTGEQSISQRVSASVFTRAWRLVLTGKDHFRLSELQRWVQLAPALHIFRVWARAKGFPVQQKRFWGEESLAVLLAYLILEPDEGILVMLRVKILIHGHNPTVFVYQGKRHQKEFE